MSVPETPGTPTTPTLPMLSVRVDSLSYDRKSMPRCKLNGGFLIGNNNNVGAKDSRDANNAGATDVVCESRFTVVRSKVNAEMQVLAFGFGCVPLGCRPSHLFHQLFCT
ncbi:Uncharacterized protein Fot_49909 [Forsythia ovata]|uniref:Uncharacterized protein n=1 Tax=Forsythia ovata TaxID=205694 RepID=A0ABD1QF08_9LAMI